MSQDPIADMLTSIRNASNKRLFETETPFSKIKEKILAILKREGFIKDYSIDKRKNFSVLKIFLKYQNGKRPAINYIKRISKPSLRVYSGKNKIKKAFGSVSVVVLSTSKGIITDKEAKKENVGGEVLFEIY